MKYRALAIDLDGTLLVGDDLPEANRLAIRAAHDAGLQVIIATARWKEMAYRVQDEAGFSGPVIACSGAQVHDRISDRDLFDERLPMDFTEVLYELCNNTRCVATVTLADRVCIKFDGEPKAGELDEDLTWMPSLDTGLGLLRIAAIQGTEINRLIRTELEPRFNDRVNFFDSIGPSGKLIITLTSKGATKGAALTSTCTHLGIPTDTVLAFGDAENDLSMFATAGTSVAMGQAEPRIQQAADYVTGRNDEAGVAQVINALLETGQLPGKL